MSWLSKRFEELTAQVNPFDHGRTASTVRAARNQAPPAQTIRGGGLSVGVANPQGNLQVTQPEQRRVKVDSIANQQTVKVSDPLKTPAINVAGQKIEQSPTMTNKPLFDSKRVSELRRIQNPITDKFRIFDANTTTDRLNRLTQGQPELYKDQQIAQGNTRPSDNVGQAFLGNTARGVNTAIATARETAPTFKAASAMLTNNRQALTNANSELSRVREATRNPNAGLFRAGTIYNGANDTPGMGDTFKRSVANYAGTVGELAPIPATKAVKGANLAVKAAKVSVASGVANAAADAGNQVITTGLINPQQTAVAAGTGAVLGGALPAIAPTTKLVARKSINAANTTTNLVNRADQAAFAPRGVVRLTPDQRNVLSDFQEHLFGRDIGGAEVINPTIAEAREIGDRIGIDMTSGSNMDIIDRITEYLDMTNPESGYMRPFGGVPEPNPEPIQPKRQLPEQSASGFDRAASVGDISSKSTIPPDLGQTNAFLDEFTKLRKQYGDDKEFFDKVILENQEASGKIGDLARHLARRDATEGSIYNENYLTEILDDELSPTSQTAQIAEIKSASLDDLKKTARQLEKDTGQKGLYSNLAKNMKDMNIDQQIAYLSDGLSKARDKGAMAAAYVNKSINQTDQPTKTTKTPFEADLETAGLKPRTPQKQAGQKYIRTSAEKIQQTPKTATQSLSEPGLIQTSTADPLSSRPEKLISRMQQSIPSDDNNIATPVTQGKPKKSRYTDKTVPKSDYVSDDLRKPVKNETPNYLSENQEARLGSTGTRIQKEGVDTFTRKLEKKLDTERGKISSQDVTDTQGLAAVLDAKGDELSLQKATELYTKLSDHLTAAGQTVQAAALIAKRSPQGLRFHAQKQLEKAGIKMTPDKIKELNQHIDAVQKAKKGTEAELIARDNVQYWVAKNLPTHTADKIVNFWRSGLLTAPTTTGGAISGNAFAAAQRKLWTNPIATMTDMVMSLKTGKRERALATPGSFGKGFGKGFGNIKSGQYWKTGYDPMNSTATGDSMGTHSRRINYGDGRLGRATGHYVNGVYKLMGAADQPFRYAAYDEVLSSLAKSDAINKGLKGKAREAHIKNFIDNPPEKAAQRAVDEAMDATFQDRTALADFISGAKQSLKQKGHHKSAALVDFLVPFSGVPSSVASRVIRNTPIGTANTLVKQIINIRKGEAFDQRLMSQAIGEGTVGLPIVAAGYALAQNDMFNGGYPSDPKERQKWTDENRQENSVKIGDRWYSLNYIQPFGTLLSVGAGIAKSEGEDGENPSLTNYLTTAAASGVKSFAGQSYLEGVTAPLDAINDPERDGGKYLASAVSGAVPNFIRSAARAADSTQRDASGFVGGIKGAIPGLRQTLPNKVGSDGNPLPNKDNFLNMYANPLKPSKVRGDTAVLKETSRLLDAGHGVSAAPIKKIEYGDTKIKLTKQEQEAYNSEVGKLRTEQWNKIISHPDYQSLSDEDKSKRLKKAAEDINAVAKYRYAQKNEIEEKPDLSKTQKSLAQGDEIEYGYEGLPKNLTKVAKEILTKDEDDEWKEEINNTSEIRNALKAWNNGRDLPPIKNSEAKKWAEYEKKGAEGSLGKLEAESEKRKILKDIYNSQLNEDEKDLYSLGKDRLKDAYDRGLINDENLHKALAVEKQLYDAGLIDKESLARKLNLGGRGYKGKGGKGKSKAGFDYTKNLFDSSSTSTSVSKSLQEILEEAMGSIKKKST